MPSTEKKLSPTEDRLRSTIRSKLQELGISAREASRRAGFNVGYVGDVLEGRSKMPEATRVLRLAETLDFDAGDFLGDSLPAESPGRSDRVFPELRSESEVVTVPLYAAPLPITAPFVALAEAPIGRAQALPALARDPTGYAITVPNNLNAPRYFVGETIYAKPGVTPKEGDFVVVRSTDKKTAIGRLGTVSAESLILRFVALDAEKSEVEVPLCDVESVHWIMGVLH